MFILTTEIDFMFEQYSEEIKLFSEYWQNLNQVFPSAVLIYTTSLHKKDIVLFSLKSNLPIADFLMSEMSGQPQIHYQDTQSKINSLSVRYIQIQNNFSFLNKQPGMYLNWLRYKLIKKNTYKFPLLVCGVSKYNETLLKHSSDYGIVLANSNLELRKICISNRYLLTKKPCVAGLVEGLTHFSRVVETNSFEIH